MQALASHDVGLAAEDLPGPLLYIHESEQTQLAALMVEEQINIGFGAGLVARDRAEKIKVLHAERLELGLVLSQSGYDLVAIHG